MQTLKAACEMNAADLYTSGMTTKQVAAALGLNMSAARKAILDGGAVMRSTGFLTEEGKQKIKQAGKARKGSKRSADACARIKSGRQAWGQENGTGFSVKPSGYIEHTRGEHKGRSVHVVIMEERIGRRLADDEVVHHIDGDRSNNNINNLALMTRSGHARLHRREQRIAREK